MQQAQEDNVTAPLSPSAIRVETYSELRWSQWLANSSYQDAILWRRAKAAFVLAGCGVAAWLGLAIYLR